MVIDEADVADMEICGTKPPRTDRRMMCNDEKHALRCSWLYRGAKALRLNGGCRTVYNEHCCLAKTEGQSIRL
jgi:hypothetical protein